LNPDYVAIANERVQNIISQQEFNLFQWRKIPSSRKSCSS
jgi:hypothetical protein